MPTTVMTLKPLVVLSFLLVAACEQRGDLSGRSEVSVAEYRPEEAGTVDHALCLLGFSAVPVRMVDPGHHLIEASINGQAGDFVLDTGARCLVPECGGAGLM